MIGKRIKGRRLSKKLSGLHLAGLVGVTQPYISAIERGVREPSRELLQSLALALGTSVSYLMGETDDPLPPHYLQNLKRRNEEGQKIFRNIL